MRAPDVEVKLSTGELVPLRSLYQKGPLVLIFLRHLGCVFCKEHVAHLRDLKELNIVFVTLGTEEQTEIFRKKMKSAHRFICDPEKKLHAQFNLNPGGLAEFMNPHVIGRVIVYMLKGYVNGLVAQGDPKMLPGVFLIQPDGELTWEHRSADIADTPRAEEIRRRLS